MTTDQLIALLSARVQPVDPRRVQRRFVALLALSGLLALSCSVLFLGLRPDLRSAADQPMFWLKLAFPASLAGAALLVSWRLGHPGMRPGAAWMGVAMPVALLWLLAAGVLLAAPAHERLALALGQTWWQCPLTVGLLSLGPLALALWAAAGLAPTRPALSGAIAGLFAGACAAAAYALHCPEMQAPFLGIWYVAGMLVPTALGAAAGRLMLRW
jgi:hypothetical protein